MAAPPRGEGFDISVYTRNAMVAIVAVIAIALAFGIGLFILESLANTPGVGQSLGNVTGILTGLSGLVNTIAVFLIIFVVAVMAVALIMYLYGGLRL